MTSPPDKLFRQGLEHYQKPAPGSAWERIESGLERKRNRGLWMKVAAGLVLLIATSTILFQLNQPESTIATVSKESEPVNSQQSAVSSRDSLVNRESSDVSREAVFIGESAGVSREAVVRRELSGVSRETLNAKKSLVDNHTQESSRQQSTDSSENALTSHESQLVAPTEPAANSMEHTPVKQVENTNEISIADAAADSKRTSITYSAEEVNAKYLKKESTTEATPEKKNTSGLQKVIDLALDLKNEGSVLGDIRDKKNEWLSINIPSNKRETNK